MNKRMLYPAQTMLGCVRKWRFSSLDRAQRAQQNMQAREPGKRVNVFYCALCGGYHLGTEPKGKH